MNSENEEALPLLEGEPAFLLDEGVAYVRGWATAQKSVAALKDALATLGLDDALPHVRADVNVFGNGIVELGRVTPQTARLLADALRRLPAQTCQTGDGRAA